MQYMCDQKMPCVADHVQCTISISDCLISGNIHIHPKRGLWKFWGEGVGLKSHSGEGGYFLEQCNILLIMIKFAEAFEGERCLIVCCEKSIRI